MAITLASLYHQWQTPTQHFVADGTTATAGTFGHCQGPPALWKKLLFIII